MYSSVHDAEAAICNSIDLAAEAGIETEEGQQHLKEVLETAPELSLAKAVQYTMAVALKANPFTDLSEKATDAFIDLLITMPVAEALPHAVVAAAKADPDSRLHRDASDYFFINLWFVPTREDRKNLCTFALENAESGSALAKQAVVELKQLGVDPYRPIHAVARPVKQREYV